MSIMEYCMTCCTLLSEIIIIIIISIKFSLSIATWHQRGQKTHKQRTKDEKRLNLHDNEDQMRHDKHRLPVKIKGLSPTHQTDNGYRKNVQSNQGINHKLRDKNGDWSYILIVRKILFLTVNRGDFYKIKLCLSHFQSDWSLPWITLLHTGIISRRLKLL